MSSHQCILQASAGWLFEGIDVVTDWVVSLLVALEIPYHHLPQVVVLCQEVVVCCSDYEQLVDQQVSACGLVFAESEYLDGRA